MSDCSPEMMREHERRITTTETRAEEAHQRINSLVDLIKDFTIEMRSSNSNISESNRNISELVTEVRTLAEKMSYVAKATEKHESDISDIKDNMETKDTVLKLYTKIEASDNEHKKGLDGIMTQLRKQNDDLEQHKLEPAREALANQNALKKWLLIGFGSIILTIASTAIMLIIFGK